MLNPVLQDQLLKNRPGDFSPGLQMLHVERSDALADLVLVFGDVLGHCERFLDVQVDKLAVSVADYAVCLSLYQDVRRIRAHNGSVVTVLTCGRSASLHVAQDRRAGLDAGRGLDPSRHGSGVADTLCIDDQMVFLAQTSSVDDVIDDLLLVVVILLGEQDVLRAVGDAAPECDVARMAAHDLDDTAVSKPIV